MSSNNGVMIISNQPVKPVKFKKPNATATILDSTTTSSSSSSLALSANTKHVTNDSSPSPAALAHSANGIKVHPKVSLIENAFNRHMSMPNLNTTTNHNHKHNNTSNNEKEQMKTSLTIVQLLAIKEELHKEMQKKREMNQLSLSSPSTHLLASSITSSQRESSSSVRKENPNDLHVDNVANEHKENGAGTKHRRIHSQTIGSIPSSTTILSSTRSSPQGSSSPSLLGITSGGGKRKRRKDKVKESSGKAPSMSNSILSAKDSLMMTSGSYLLATSPPAAGNLANSLDSGDISRKLRSQSFHHTTLPPKSYFRRNSFSFENFNPEQQENRNGFSKWYDETREEDGIVMEWQGKEDTGEEVVMKGDDEDIVEETVLDMLSSLPDECALQILAHLGMTDLCKLSQVSRRWHSITADHIVWKSAYMKFWSHQFKGNHTTKLYNRVSTVGFHGHTINSIQFDHQKLVTAGRDGWIKIWKWSSESSISCVHTITDHDGPVLCCQYDEEKLISGSADRTIRVYDMKNYKCKAILKGHTESVSCLQFDKKYIISGGRDGVIKAWDVKRFKCIATFHYPSPISSLKFTKDIIVCAAEDHRLRVFNLKNKKCKYEVKLPGFIWCVELENEDQKIITSCSDKCLRIFKIPSDESWNGSSVVKSKKKLECMKMIPLDTTIYSMQCDKHNIFLGTKEGVVLYDYSGTKVQEIWKGGRRVSALKWKGNRFIFSQMDIDYEGERIPLIDLIVMSLH